MGSAQFSPLRTIYTISVRFTSSALTRCSKCPSRKVYDSAMVSLVTPCRTAGLEDEQLITSRKKRHFASISRTSCSLSCLSFTNGRPPFSCHLHSVYYTASQNIRVVRCTISPGREISMMWIQKYCPLLVAVGIFITSAVVNGLSYDVPGSPCSGDANVKSCLPAVDAPSLQCVQYSKDHDFCAIQLRSQNVAPGHHCMAAGEIGPGNTFSPGFWEVSRRVENGYQVSTPKFCQIGYYVRTVNHKSTN